MVSSINKILIVDDEPGILALTRLVLERKAGLKVLSCGSGVEALSKAKGFAPDVVLIDYNMPGMSGAETVSAFKKMPEFNGAVYIIMSAAEIRKEELETVGIEISGVLVKPFDEKALLEAVSIATGVSVGGNSVDLNSQIRLLREEYKGRLPVEISALYEGCKQYARTGDIKHLNKLSASAHRLYGTSSTFGFAELGAATKALEEFAKAAESYGSSKCESCAETLRGLIITIQNAADTDIDFKPLSQNGLAIDTGADNTQDETRLVWLFDSGSPIMGELHGQLSYYGYSVERFDTISGLLDCESGRKPSAIVLDIKDEAGNRNSFNIIESVRSHMMNAPLLVISTLNTIGDRLQFVRAGCAGYFTHPAEAGRIIDKIEELTASVQQTGDRILIIDDDKDIAQFYSYILKSAGMSVLTVNDPLMSLDALESFSPDLILMDINMPECTGMELSSVIRQLEQYVSIPIVFLSSETRGTRQQLAMSTGGDDFLVKPVSPESLITSIRSRVKRSRILRSYMVCDSLTGLLNHSRTKEKLDIEVKRAARQKSSVSFCIIDLDKFKSINDTYGHPTGDKVIRSIASLLKRRLRKTDIIGRYGGEEFAVILPDTSKFDAFKVLDAIRLDFALLRHSSDNLEFNVTYSAGISSYPDHDEPVAMTNAADKALYEAKRNGRNNIVLG